MFIKVKRLKSNVVIWNVCDSNRIDKYIFKFSEMIVSYNKCFEILSFCVSKFLVGIK